MQSLKMAFAIVSFGITIGIFSAPPSGMVFDYNSASKKVTVMTQTPAAFTMGQTAYIIRDKKEIGQITISMNFHTKFVGTLNSGDLIKKNDIVVLNLGDAGTVPPPKLKRESFKDKSLGRGWMVKFTCEGAPKGTEVERKLNLANKLVFKKSGESNFSHVETSTVQSLQFHWMNGSLSGKSITLKGNKKIPTDEILAKNVFGKFKPDISYSDTVKECKITLNKAKDVLDENPDGVPIEFKVRNVTKALGEGKAYLLKVYSNSLFATEFLLDITRADDGKLENTFYISPADLYSGSNQFEFYIVEADKTNTDYFEKGEQKKIGEKTLEFTEQSLNSTEFSIREDNGALVVR
jgi:hypothetical protein